MAACQHCGREAHERDQFCQYCGHRLDTGATEPQQPALVAAALGSADGASQASDAPSTAAASSPAFPASPPSLASAPWPAGDDDPAQPSAPVAAPIGIPDLDTVPVPDPPPPSDEPKSRLMIRKAASEGDPEREEVLGDRDVAIGRSPSCDVVLEGDELASRRHALIRARGGRYTLVDLGSSNGTYVNGYEIRGESELHDGDRIAVGSHELIFAVGTPGPNASLAGSRAGNLPPRPASATLRPDTMDGASGEGEDAAGPGMGSVGVEQHADGAALDVAAAGSGSEEDGSAVSRAETKTAPLSAATPEELEALRLQIADIAGALARKADTETRAAQHYRGALAEARDQLAALLRETQAPQNEEAREREQRAELATMAREAADHPRHLDYLSRLAENAGAIADALNTAPSNADLLNALLDLLARMNEALD